MKTLLTFMLVFMAGTASADGSKHLVADIPSTDGVLIHAESRGSGTPPIVLVHGWSCDSTYWLDQVTDLAADYRVITIDLAGHGKSGTDREIYTMAAFGQDVAAVLDKWDLKQVILVGHSMGGAVITEAALAVPRRILGLIGVDNFQQLNMKLGSRQIEGFTATFEQDFPGFTRQWVSSMFPIGADSVLIAEISGDMAAAPPAIGLSALRELLHWYGALAPSRIAELKVPLMCINSDKQPTDEAAMLAVVPRYQVRYMPGHGHFLFREDPVTFNKLLRETIAAMMPR